MTPTDIDDPTYISPVDIAAAFWYSNFRESDTTQGPRDDGSLYAWTMITKSNFSPTTVGFGNDLFDMHIYTCLHAMELSKVHSQVTAVS